MAAVARGDTVHVATAGVMALDGPPMRRDTLFRIASITKPMTAATVLPLVDDGTLALDEPIERLLPELADQRVLRRPDGPLDETVPAARAVTVRDLLTFTWGFGMQGAMLVAEEPWPIYTATRQRDLAALGPWHRDDLVQRPGAGPDRRGAHPALVGRDGSACGVRRRARRGAGGGDQRRVTTPRTNAACPAC